MRNGCMRNGYMRNGCMRNGCMRNGWCALWHGLYFHSLSACLLVICTLSRSCSVSLSYTRTRTKTISFSVFSSRANRGLHLPPSLPPPFPTHSLALQDSLQLSCGMAKVRQVRLFLVHNVSATFKTHALRMRLT